MKKKKPLKVIAGAPDRPLVIGEIAISCYVLEGETRVLSQRGLQSSIGLGTGGGQQQIGAPRLAEFLGFFARKGIDIQDLAARLEMPIKFQPPGGGRTAYGYPATLLVDLCNMVLEARKQGTLLKRQQRIAERCELLIRGFATVGIIALVDEATGYQAIRARRALATILEKFIAKALRPWTRTFPYEFYEQIFRLKGWPGPAGVRGPRVLGHYTNDLVYQRLAPGVFAELRSKNPTMPYGTRKNKHHQWFTPDPGYVKLNQHIAAVMALMRAAPNWAVFHRSLERAFPKQNETMPFLFDDDWPHDSGTGKS